MKKLVLFSLISSFLIACNKEAGEGGTSSITGKVYRIETNALGESLTEYYAMDYDVYINYGTADETYDDKFATSLDGSYKFSNLTLGTYKVFAYTRCDLCPSGDTVVTKTIEITEKGKEYNIENLVVYK